MLSAVEFMKGKKLVEFVADSFVIGLWIVLKTSKDRWSV